MKLEELKQQLEKQLQVGGGIGVAYPTKIFGVDHQQAVFTLTDRATKEQEIIGSRAEFVLLRAYLQTRVFTMMGVLKYISQIVLPNEKRNMLELKTSLKWSEVASSIKDEDNVVNILVVPILLIRNGNYEKYIAEFKGIILKNLIDFRANEKLNNLNGLILNVELKKRDLKIRKYAELEVIAFRKLLDEKDEKLFQVAYDWLTEFEDWRKKYDVVQALSNETEEIEIPAEW